MARWRLAHRLARREVRRHPWRHGLVVLMILVPALAAFAMLSLVESYDATLAQRNAARAAGGEVSIDSSQGDTSRPADLPASIRAQFAAGSRVANRWTTADWLVSRHQRRDGRGPELIGTQVDGVPAGSWLFDRYRVQHGRLPDRAGEVFLTRKAAEAGGWQVGDTATSARTDRALRVVGIGVDRAATDATTAVVASARPGPWATVLDRFPTVQVGNTWIDQHPTWTTVVDLPRGDDCCARQSTSPTVFQPEDPQLRVGPSVVVVTIISAALVAIVASAAFAISNRRQLRAIGQLAAAGVDPGTIWRALALQGSLTGLLAGALAVALGLLVIRTASAAGVAEQLWHVDGATLAASALGAGVAIVVATAAGTAAAWQPARTASRIPVLTALAGRRPVPPLAPRVRLTSVAIWAGGCALLALGVRLVARGGATTAALAGLLVVGAIAVVAIGGVLTASMVAEWVGRLGARVGGTLRLALRTIGRQRGSSAATMAAVAIALALPVGAIASSVGDRADQVRVQAVRDRVEPASRAERTRALLRARTAVAVRGSLRSSAATDARDEVSDLLGPSATTVEVVPLVDGEGRWRNVATIDEAAADAVLPPGVATAIRQGQAVSLARSGGGRVTFAAAGDEVTLPVVPAFGDAFARLPSGNAAYLVGTKALAGVGRARPRDMVLVVRRAAPDEHERATLEAWARNVANDITSDPTLGEIEAARGTTARHATDDVWLELLEPIPGLGDGSSRAADASSWWARSSWRSRFFPDGPLLVFSSIGATIATLIVLVALGLRSADGADDRRAAAAMGAAPAQLDHQRTLEGVVLALAGAALGLAIGWSTVLAARIGAIRKAPSEGAGNVVLDRWVTPSWQVVPVLLVPALVVGLGWWLVPAIARRLRRLRRGPAPDLLAPRW